MLQNQKISSMDFLKTNDVQIDQEKFFSEEVAKLERQVIDREQDDAIGRQFKTACVVQDKFKGFNRSNFGLDQLKHPEPSEKLIVDTLHEIEHREKTKISKIKVLTMFR